MTEFAFSGLGINPHYGTPANPYDRKAGRIPGGSSSGAAVSVTDGMAFAGLGTDTGGSCRIPAALCGIVGFKPTAHRVPTQGAFPLSTSLDSIGPIAPTVACCAILDAVLAGEPVVGSGGVPARRPAARGAADHGARRRCARGRAGVRRRARSVAQGGRQDRRSAAARTRPSSAQINAKGGPSAAESYAAHRALIAKGAAMYDPRVLVRILRGKEQDAADYIELLEARAGLHPPRRGGHGALRRAGDADHADHCAADRRSGSRRRLSPRQRGDAAQSVGREFPRPLLDLDSMPPRGRCAGRPDADRRARRRPASCCAIAAAMEKVSCRPERVSRRTTDHSRSPA